MRLAIVSAICGVIVAYAIASYAGKPEDMSLALYSGLFLIATTLATSALTLLAHFRYYFFTASSRMYWEDQKKIADLESQLDQQLDLNVTVFSVSTMSSVGISHLQLSRDGLVLFLQDIRSTNRSKVNKVSLELTLMVPGRGGYFEVGEGKEYWEMFPAYLLFSPIDIDPEKTSSGNMCFLIPPETVLKHGGKWKINYNQCRLKIVDRVSGKLMIQDISQEDVEARSSRKSIGDITTLLYSTPLNRTSCEIQIDDLIESADEIFLI
jgi:hypothetical protein